MDHAANGFAARIRDDRVAMKFKPLANVWAVLMSSAIFLARDA
jgi:hypothetical protein